MARIHLAQNVSGSSTWRTVAGTKEEVAGTLAEAAAAGIWPTIQFEGREEVVINPAAVLWVTDS